MKTLIFDLLVTQPNRTAKFHGGGEYVKTLFFRLLQHTDKLKIIAVYNADAFLDPAVAKVIEEHRLETVCVENHQELQNSGLFERADIYLCGLSEPVIRMSFPQGLQVITVYHNIRSLEKPIDCTSHLYSDNLKTAGMDVIRYLCGEWYRGYEKKKVQKAFDKSSYIVGVSRSAVSSVDLFFPDIPEEKKLLVYAPLRLPPICMPVAKTEERYILMLGGDRWVKNAYRGLRAIDQLFGMGQLQQFRVKIVGEVSGKIKSRVRNSDRFDFLPYMDTYDLQRLYQSCDFFFYPTMNEGFGYPPLEAMRYGKTCVVSSVTSLPEIYGDSVYYCSPYDRWEMMSRILYASGHKIDQSVIRSRFEKIVQMSNKSVDDFIQLLTGENC